MKLLKNLSHPNIVVSMIISYIVETVLACLISSKPFSFGFQRYLGTAREEESLNILLEFVPGGSISSLLGKFGSFPESVSNIIPFIQIIDILHYNK